MRTIEKPWGSEQIVFEDSDRVVKIIEVRPGARLSLQFHQLKVESLVHLRGDGYIEVHHDDGNLSVHELYDGSSPRMVMIEQGTVHRIGARAGGPGCSFLELSHGPQDDVVRVQDDYGRTERSLSR